MSFLDNKSVLITGGTGTFGNALTQRLLTQYNLKRLVIYSRDEFKQYEMSLKFNKPSNTRFFLGDVRDVKRLSRACDGIDIIVHAAALKQVPAAEYNPDEFIKTNINGAQNVIEVALDRNIEAVVALSTDKAAAPINLYGATKLVSDKLFVAANNIKGHRDLRFSVVRYGNVLGSRGSVIPFFLKESKSGRVPITHKDMTRFNMAISDAVDTVLWSIENSLGGEIIVPKLKSFTLDTIASAIEESLEIDYIGLRPGEKLHEEMITASDSYNTIDIGDHYMILPSGGNLKKYTSAFNGTLVSPGFSYASNTNSEWIDVKAMRGLINQYIEEYGN
jgi:UDP-N-acetylglucosamine 4,6-dehydratase